MDISVTINIIDLKCSVCILKVLIEGRKSQIYYLGHSFHFMAKNLLSFLAKQFSTFHRMKPRT